MSEILVRKAVVGDAAGAIELLRDSITQLCVDDHQNDAQTLQLWLQNKTEEAFQRWIQNADLHLVVAEGQAHLMGVGAIDSGGRIRLLYVKPGFQRIGVGVALLCELERQATDWSLPQVTLGSSLGARAFYERHGYVSTGPPEPGFGISRAFPYAKSLA